jgi:S1-C subfamily serine protease
VIVSFDNFEIASFESLTRAVADCRPNESVMLGVRRGNEDVKIRVRLGMKPEKQE